MRRGISFSVYLIILCFLNIDHRFIKLLSLICFIDLIFIPTERKVLAANRVEGVEDLAYDWISKNLYWTDPRYRSISVMKVADKSRRAIVRNLNNPRSIVVHPTEG